MCCTSGITTPHTVVAQAGIRFNSTGYIAYRSGGTGSSFVDQALIWGDAAPPSVGYKIRFDRYAAVNVISGAGMPTLTGSFGSQQTLNSSNAQDVQLFGSNVVAEVFVAFTLYDSTGATQLETGLLKLRIESTD